MIPSLVGETKLEFVQTGDFLNSVDITSIKTMKNSHIDDKHSRLLK